MGMVILAFINAMVVLVLYLVLGGLPFPPLMATLAFLITLIPLVGPLLFLVLGSVVALFVNPRAGARVRDHLPRLHPDRGVRHHAAGDEPGDLIPGSLVVIGASSAARCSVCSVRSSRFR